MVRMRKLLFLLAALIGGPVLIVGGIGEYKNSKQLQANGKVVTADVVDAKETVSRKGRHKYYLTIEYKPEQGAVQRATTRVTSSEFSHGVTAKSVPVIYLPSKPQVFQLGDKATTDSTSIIIGCVLLVGGLGYAGFIWLAYRSSKGGANVSSQGPMGIPASPAPAPTAN